MASARYLLYPRQLGSHPGVSWRLIAPNNREIARGSRPFPTVEELTTELADLRAWAATAPARMVREPASTTVLAGWRWQLDVEQTAVAVSSRSYQRRIECEVALTQFRSVAPTAVADLVVRGRA